MDVFNPHPTPPLVLWVFWQTLVFWSSTAMCLCFPTTGFKLQFSAWFYHNISIPFQKLVEFYLGSSYTVSANGLVFSWRPSTGWAPPSVLNQLPALLLGLVTCRQVEEWRWHWLQPPLAGHSLACPAQPTALGLFRLLGLWKSTKSGQKWTLISQSIGSGFISMSCHRA